MSLSSCQYLAVSGIHRFDLCQRGKSIKGGFTPKCSCGVLEPCTIPSEEIIDVNKFYTKEVEVTDVIGHQRWSFLKPLTAKMTDSLYKNLPTPLLILYECKKGKRKEKRRVILSPKENQRRYGNLIDEYLTKSQVVVK